MLGRYWTETTFMSDILLRMSIFFRFGLQTPMTDQFEWYRQNLSSEFLPWLIGRARVPMRLLEQVVKTMLVAMQSCTLQCWSTTREVIKTALYCKHRIYFLGRAQQNIWECETALHLYNCLNNRATCFIGSFPSLHGFLRSYVYISNPTLLVHI